MKNLTYKFYSVFNILLITVFLTSFMSACSSAATPVSTPSISIKVMADNIAKDFGQVMQFADGSNTQIIVFEEIHSSPGGQVEIAIMMNRLYESYKLRHIALEGYFADSAKFDNSWMPDLTPREREDVIVQHLQDGEISSGEMMAMVYNDLTVTGIEIENEYSYEPPASAWNAPTFYLYQIAAPNMTNDETDKANSLIKDEKILEALEFIISSDDWTAKEYALTKDDKTIISAEGWLKILDEIDAKASNIDISADDKQAMKDLRKFYETASHRTETMVNNTLSIASPNTPIAMVVGAAHTELVAKLLGEKGVSFAVVRGNSLANNLKNGDLNSDQYNRKSNQLSVDSAGTLGALLDGRKKPQPVINKQWFQSKTEIYMATTRIAHEVKDGKKPPFDDILSKFTNIRIDPSSILIKGDNVIFSVTAPDDKGKDVKIWVKARAKNKSTVNLLLEERLKFAYNKIENKDTTTTDTDGENTKHTLEEISTDTIAKFSVNEAEIKGSDDI